VPIDFIGTVDSQRPMFVDVKEGVPNHDELMANFFAQPDALASGKTADELKKDGVKPEVIPHRVMPGNRPSTVVMLSRLTAFEAGQLLALYEHRTAVEGFVWGINSFDQMGVELGKQLATTVRKSISVFRQAKDKKVALNLMAGMFNPSTTMLLNRYLAASAVSAAKTT